MKYELSQIITQGLNKFNNTYKHSMRSD